LQEWEVREYKNYSKKELMFIALEKEYISCKRTELRKPMQGTDSCLVFWTKEEFEYLTALDGALIQGILA